MGLSIDSEIHYISMFRRLRNEGQSVREALYDVQQSPAAEGVPKADEKLWKSAHASYLRNNVGLLIEKEEIDNHYQPDQLAEHITEVILAAVGAEASLFAEVKSSTTVGESARS